MKVLIFDRAKNREKLLQAYPGIYGVDSETNDNVTYGISDNQFSVIKTCGVIACDISEMPQVAEMYAEQGLKDEIMALYEDIKEYGIGLR